MKYQSYLIIEGVDLPLPNSYDLEFRDIEADTGGETEAGTIQSNYCDQRKYPGDER